MSAALGEERESSVLVLSEAPSPKVEGLWRDFLARADFPTHYVSPDFFAEPFFLKKRPFAILSLERGRVMAVVTGICDKNSVQCGVPGRPHLAVDPSASEDTLRELVGALKSHAAGADLITVVTWSTSPAIRSAGFSEKTFGEVVMLDLGVGSAALFKNFSKGRRSDITFATRNGVVIREATTQEDFDEYYKIYVTWSKQKGLPIETLETMRAALALRSNRKLFLALHENKVIAGSIMRYVAGGIAEYAANSSLDEALSLKPNALLVWTAIRWACSEGLTQFSMGAAHPFLRHFGGNIVSLCRYRLDQTLFRRHDATDWMNGNLRKALSRVKRLKVSHGSK